VNRLPATPLLLDAAGRGALVTGAAGGIGRATVALLRAAGAQVAAIDRVAVDAGDGVFSLLADATDEGALETVVAAAAARLGGIDYVVHAVGAVGAGPLHETSLQDWRRLLDANLTSAFLLARACHRYLRRPGGALVLLSSTNGRNGGGPLSGAAYAAAKAGILNLTRYLAKEWAAEGMRVNCVAPGPVDTPMLERLTEQQHQQLMAALPLKRYAQAEEVAGTIAFLFSSYAASITGSCINVSGGMLLD